MAYENDNVLIYYEDKPLVFGRIESIEPNSKPNWYHVTILLLQIPLQKVTWILKDEYLNNQEFTMEGKRMRIEDVVCPVNESIGNESLGSEDTKILKEASKSQKKGKIISLADRMKR